MDDSEPNSLTPEQLAAFLEAMRTHYPQHCALVAPLAYTGLRFCHASALRWEDWDEPTGVLRVVRKHFRGEIGPVSRKKRAPKEYPVEPELAEILREHRLRVVGEQAKGLEAGWMKHAEITKRFTVHGLRVHVHRPGTPGERGRGGPPGVDRPRDRGDAAALLDRRPGREAGGDRRRASPGAASAPPRRWE